jgi:archaellum component FlaG (FlaF/FlaG flagellin family)
VTSVDISADGTQALSGSLDGAMILWDLASGRKLHAFPAQPSQVNAVAISPDGSTAISGGGYPFRWKQTLSLWDLAKRTKGWSADDASTVNSVVFSSDGRKAFTGHGDIIDRQWLVRRWDILTGKWEWSSTGHEYPVLSVALAKDGKHVLSGSMDGTLRLWDAGNGQEVRAFRGHRGGVASASFSPDGRYAISTGLDSTVRWWDIATAREIVQFVEFQNGEWIAITPEGYYNSSANGDHHINVRVGNQVFGIDQYRSTFYRPDVVQAALDLGDSARAIAAVLGDSAQRPTLATAQKIEPPFVVIKSPDEGQNLATAHALLSLYIEDRNQKVNSVRVFVNGRKVTGQDQRGVQVVSREQIPEMDASGIRIPEGKNQIDLKIPLALDPGPNRIEVTVSNGFSEGRKSITVHSAAVAATEAGTRLLPNLWILSIGINQYQTATFRPLAFAVADAEGIVQAFQKQQGRLFKEVHSLLITDRSEVKPTFESVMDNLKFLSRAGHNDVVLLFLAGHGVTDDRGQFYFLPSDAMFDEDGSIKRSKAVSWREIHQALDLPSRKLIFADTCHSEGLAGKRTRSVDSDRFVKELQDANAVIFTSSRGNELSQEQEVWGHGAFTYALLQGLDGKADLIKDRKISMKELDAYVSETVPQLTKGAQHPITNTPEGYVDFPVTLTE